MVQTYIDFLRTYQEIYPENLIVLIGDKDDKGNSCGVNLIQASLFLDQNEDQQDNS